MKATIDYSQNERLLEALKRTPKNVESKLNELLRKTGMKMAKDSIVEEIPRSPRRKVHAKDSNPLQGRMAHLGFTITTKPKFNYLIFPNDGIGRRNPMAQKFFELGIELVEEPLLDKIIDTIEKEM